MGDCAGSLTARYGWVQSFYWMGFAALMGFASLFLLDAGFRTTEIGLIIDLSGGISALLQPAAASLAEGPGRVGLKSLICGVCLLIAAAALGLTALCLTRGPALGTALLYGGCLLLLQINFPLINALGTEAINQGRRLNWGAARGLGSVAYAAASAGLGLLTKRAGAVAVPLLVLASFLLTAACVPSFPLRPRQAGGGEEGTGNASPLAFFRKYPRFGLLLAGTTLLYMGHMGQNSFTFQIMQSKGGGSAEMGLATALAAFWELPVMFCFGLMLRRVRCEVWMRLSALFFTVKAALVWLAPSVSAFYAAQTAQLLGWGLISVDSVHYNNGVMEEGDAIKGQAYFTMTFTLGSVLGALGGGRMLDAAGVNALLGCICILSAAGTLLAAAGVQSPRDGRA